MAYPTTDIGIKNSPPALSIAQRRWAWNMAYWNIGLWAIGNGLSSSTLVVYLALELDAPKIGLGIGLILAMRHLVGLLRLAAPVLIGRIADRKTFCLGTFFLSGLLLFCLPFLSAPGTLRSAGMSLAALVILWTLHHLMQYLGTIALFSWLADVAPLRIRGRFFRLSRTLAGCRRSRRRTCLRIVLILVDRNIQSKSAAKWIGYAIPAGLGAWFMIAAISAAVADAPG